MKEKEKSRFCHGLRVLPPDLFEEGMAGWLLISNLCWKPKKGLWTSAGIVWTGKTLTHSYAVT